MPNDNLKKYYDYLKANGADVAPTYDAFANALSDENNARKYHSYLLKNGFDAPTDYNKFVNRLGLLKKKEVSQSTQEPKVISSVTSKTENQKHSESLSSARRWANVTEPRVTPEKYKTDDYIDVLENKPLKKKKVVSVQPDKYVPEVKVEELDVPTYKEAETMMEEDFGRKEFDAYQNINKIDKNIVFKSEEEAVKELREKFKGSGFIFEETGIGNKIKISTSTNGGLSTINSMEFDLLPPSMTEEKTGLLGALGNREKQGEERYNQIIDFMNKSILKKTDKDFLKKDVKDYGQLVNLMAENPYKYGEEFLNQYDTDRWFDNQYKDLVIESKSLKRDEQILLEQYNEFLKNPTNTEREAEIKNKINSLEERKNILKSKYDDLGRLNDKLKVSSAVYYKNKEKQGNTIGLISKSFMKGAFNMEKALAGVAADVMPYVLPEGSLMPDVQRAKLKASGMSDAEIKDYASKQLRKQIVPQIEKGLTNLVSFGTTDEYIQSKDRNDLEKVASFLAESIGTAASAGGNPALQKVAFFTQSYNAIEDEMNSSQFDGLNQFEKKLISVPYGLTIGALENLGFRFTTGATKSPLFNKLVNNIVFRTFSNLPKDASVTLMQNELKRNTAAMLANAGLRIVGGALVEGAVEGVQQLDEIAIKNISNAITEKDYFQDVPDITTAEGINQAIGAAATDAYYGALGGLIMSGGSESVSAIRDGYSNRKSDDDFAIFSNSLRDNNLRSSIESDIKAKIVSGDITKEEAKAQIESMNKSYSILQSIPDNLSLRDQRDSFNLILEKQKIQKEIEGKDPALVAAQTNRVNEINNELKTISENAVQKQTTGEVPVQSEATVGREVEEGKPQAEPQGVAEESQAVQEVINKTRSRLLTTENQTEFDKNPIENAKKDIDERIKYIESLESRDATDERILKELKDDYNVLTGTEVVSPIQEEVNKLRSLFGEQPKSQKEEQAVETEEDVEVKKILPQLASAERTMIQLGKSTNPNNTNEVTYTDLSDTSVKDDFTPFYKSITDYLKKNDEVTIYDEANNKTYSFKLDGNTLISTRVPNVTTTKFQKGEQPILKPEVDSVVEEMNAMPEDVAKFDVPSNLTTKNKTNISSLIKRFGNKLKSAFKGGVIKNISEYNGIPMIFTISDQLSSGKVKNEFTGNTIDVNGGIGFNLTEGNENSAWANTDIKEAESMLARAKEVYAKNKDLFDRLWAEGKLPKGQVPMAIVKMGQKSIKTNEALFRFAADTIRNKFSETERQNSLNGLIEDISAVNPESKVLTFIKENNFTTIDQLLDNMNNLKPIGERENVTRFLFTGNVELNKQTKAGKPRSKSGLALVGDKDASFYKYIHLQTINNAIQDESTKEIPSNHIIGITGVDVLNPEITNPKHRNYPYGVKGGLIGILESPVHASDIFPEMYAKSFYLNKEDKAGKLPSPTKTVDQAVASSGPIAGIKAFRGAKISVKMTELQKLLGKLRQAFPSVTIVETQEEFNKTLENPEVKKFVKDGEVVYGFTKDGKVFLNPEKANSNTAIHEFAHIWMGFLKNTNPKLLAKGYSLLEGTEVLKRKIAELGDTELAREEAMAELIANKGETLIEAGKKSKFKNWLNAVFTYVKSKFKTFDKLTPEQFQNISLNEFIDGSLASLLGGKEVTSKEIKNIDVLFSKGKPREAVDVVKVARENGISDAAIKQYLKEEGFENYNDLFDSATAIKNAKEKYTLSVEKRGNSQKQGVDAALNDLRKSDWYNVADDTQRENAERELKEFFGEKIKKAPSVAKITGKPKAKKVAIKDEYKAMITQIKLEAKAAREAKADLNTKRKMLAAAISGMVKTGKIKASQAATLIKRISSLNLDNPVMVERFSNYAERVFERADYQQRLDDAFSVRKNIRKLLKTENQAEVVGMAKAFTKIDPSLVEDIDAYMEMAEKVKNAVKPSRVQGLDVVMKEAANIAEISDYTNEEIARQEQIKKDELLATYDFLEGDMSLKDMQDVINALKDPTSKMDTSEKEKYVKDYLNGRFGIMSSILETMFQTGVDPMTGENITFDEKQKELIKRAMKIDLNEMSVRDAIKIVESLENFITNQITSGIEAAVSSYEGAMNVKSLVNRGKKAKSLRLFFSKYVGKIYSEQLFSLPMLMEKMFGGVTNSIDVMNKMGLNKLVNGVNKANRQHNEIIDEYSKQPFYATKNALGRYVMNKGFMDAENVYERGMLAFLKRNLVGNPSEMKAEFERRVRMVQESINKLIEDGDPKEQKMGELYQKIYDKLGVAEMDMDVINSNASKNNLDAVNWWVNQWSKHYSDLSDISLSVYNTQLGSDLNYTPDKYKKLSSENQSLDEGAVERNGAFAITIDYTDKNKTGVLMETTRPNVMPDGRYISLDFDNNNSKALKSALTDINTAAAIRQVDGFINSKSFKKLIPEAEDRTIMTKRINTYIRRAKGKSIVASDTIQYLNKLVNFATALGVGKALGGINQAVMQTTPVMVNTIFNAGRFDIADASFNAWLNKSGLPISNRGLESQSTVQSIDRKIDMKGTGTQEALKKVADLNQWYLKQFLVKPDVFVARSSFKSYYLQNLKRRGISTDIDWTTHEIDMEAAEYAQAMIDRQQNISDPMLAGEFLASDEPMKQIARKIVLPFASFILNQKARMYNDLNTWSSKTSTREDKIIAWRSLAGLATELATYQLIGFGIRRLYDMIAASLLGDDDDEETKKKKMINATKYPVKSIVNDIISPLPITDGITTWGLNQALKQYPWMSEKEIKDAVDSRNKVLELKGEPAMTASEEEDFIKNIKDEATYQVFDNEFDRSYGMIGIAGSTYQELGEMGKLATTGEFTDEYQGRETTKKLLESDREKVKYAVPFMVAYSTGLLPKDIGAISRNYVNRIKKKAITEKQYDRYDAVQKELGRNLKSWEIDMVKSKKESETAISEIEFIEQNGGLTERQGREYLKLMKAIGEPSISDFTRIKNGETADQILK